MVLYDYWRSSASYRLRIALNLASIRYDIRPVDLIAGEQRTAAHLARNPQGLVPVLDIDGARFTQSLACLSYLDRTRNLGLLPADPIERTHVEALAQSIAVDLHPVCNLSVARFGVAQSGGTLQMGDWMRQFITPGLTAFSALLEHWPEADFCVGDSPGLADICLLPQLYNARRWEIDLTPFARLLKVEAACAKHPAFAAAHPDRHQPSV
ncbi:maleylpyruvate isomerase [Tritonibacter horizontis]|uniref:Maleylpyruvate isomerase n=1 Tax=Tritonibacter horizontis TaxID=1768241 RepID=A0A132BTZ5_9RHOB|nr:maleylpyruvate isomerase [Tritonibacter horizontis]